MPERIYKIIQDHFNGNQTEFAEHMGYAQQTVNAWCSGRNEPRCDAIIDICTEFKVSADWLLGIE